MLPSLARRICYFISQEINMATEYIVDKDSIHILLIYPEFSYNHFFFYILYRWEAVLKCGLRICVVKLWITIFPDVFCFCNNLTKPHLITQNSHKISVSSTYIVSIQVSLLHYLFLYYLLLPISNCVHYILSIF